MKTMSESENEKLKKSVIEVTGPLTNANAKRLETAVRMGQNILHASESVNLRDISENSRIVSNGNRATIINDLESGLYHVVLIKGGQLPPFLTEEEARREFDEIERNEE